MTITRLFFSAHFSSNLKNPLEAKGFADRLTEHKETIDTVKHAAQRIGCSEAEIAKTLSFIVDEKPVIVVIAGDGGVTPSEFKAVFHTKPMLELADFSHT